MLDVDIAKGKNGCLLIKPIGASRTAIDAIKSLLTTKFSDKLCGFTIAVEDFPTLTQQLELMGATDPGVMSEEASALIQQHETRRNELIALKKISISENGADPWDHPDNDIIRTIKAGGAKTKPYPDQIQCIKFHIDRGRSLEASETGTGKAESLNSLLLTPQGWVKMGDIKIGDRICTPNGKNSKVLSIHPQGTIAMYRVEFSDGTAVECSKDHLWFTYTRVNRVNRSRAGKTYNGYTYPPFNGGSVKTTAEIARTIKHVGYHNHSIPITSPIKFAEKSLPIDPYLLGVLIGDGDLGNVSLTNSDKELIDIAKKLLPKLCRMNKLKAIYKYSIIGTHGKNPARTALKVLNLFKKRAWEKFVPQLYLFNSIKNRISILQGLLDTDGWVQNSGISIGFSSASEQLTDDVRFLVESLGGICYKRRKKCHYTKNGVRHEARDAHILEISLPPKIAPFRISRKVCLVAPRTKYPPARFIVAVKATGKKPAQCIRIANADGLYLTDHCIVTHNSLSVLFTYLYWKKMGVAKKGLILCLNAGKLDWEKEIQQHTNLTSLTVGNGSDRVIQDFQNFKRGNIDLLICHYESLYQGTDEVFNKLKELSFDFVGADESHILKNPEAKRHKRIIDLISNLGDIKLVCATGTAIDGNPKSAWATLKLIEGTPGRYFPTYYEFSKHFIIKEPRFFYGRPIMVETGFKNLKRLKEWMSYTSIRFLKSEVLNRPSKIFKTIPVDLKGAQKELYDQVKSKIREEVLIEKGDHVSLVDATARVLRLRQILNHPKIIEEVTHFSGDSAKYVALDEVLEDILSNPDSQVLVWTQWRKAVEFLVKRYTNYGSIAFYGGSDDRDVRERVISKRAKVIIAIPEKAGTSIDWLKSCRTAIYLEKPWSLSLYRQSLDRIDRRVNIDPALIISIEGANSVDQLVNGLLQKRQEVFDALSVEDEKLIALNKEDLLKYLT